MPQLCAAVTRRSFVPQVTQSRAAVTCRRHVPLLRAVVTCRSYVGAVTSAVPAVKRRSHVPQLSVVAYRALHRSNGRSSPFNAFGSVEGSAAGSSASRARKGPLASRTDQASHGSCFSRLSEIFLNGWDPINCGQTQDPGPSASTPSEGPRDGGGFERSFGCHARARCVRTRVTRARVASAKGPRLFRNGGVRSRVFSRAHASVGITCGRGPASATGSPFYRDPGRGLLQAAVRGRAKAM